MTEFVLSLPASLPATEAVAKAKARGMTMTEGNVHRVRRLFGARSPQSPSTPATGKSGRAGRTVASTPRPVPRDAPSKAAFVRDLPRNMAAKEVVELGAARGLELDVHYVYKVRSSKPPPVRGGAPARVGSPAASLPSPSTGTAKAEDVLRAIASEIGLARAVEILQGERTRVRAVIDR